MRWVKLQKLLAVVAMGGMPLATVSSCDYGAGGGNFYLDREVDAFYGPGYVSPGGYDVVVEEVYYEEDVYYDDYYYEDEYWYEEEYYEEDEWYFDIFDWF
ncbi:MAG: hypothetical protein GY842_21355 [bacterium]|nr:hypothetical protein [bacterium]